MGHTKGSRVREDPLGSWRLPGLGRVRGDVRLLHLRLRGTERDGWASRALRARGAILIT